MPIGSEVIEIASKEIINLPTRRYSNLLAPLGLYPCHPRYPRFEMCFLTTDSTDSADERH